jgi:hypothetical protein
MLIVVLVADSRKKYCMELIKFLFFTRGIKHSPTTRAVKIPIQKVLLYALVA